MIEAKTSLFFWIFGPPKLWIFGFLAASRNFQAQGRKFKIAGIHSEATAKAGTIWPSTEACTLTDIATLGLGRPGGPAKPQGCKVCRSPGLSAWTFCPSCGCGFWVSASNVEFPRLCLEIPTSGQTLRAGTRICIGCALHLHWCSIEIALSLHRFCIGIVMHLHWFAVDIVLQLHWFCNDFVLNLHWICIEGAPSFCNWFCIECVLIVYWICIRCAMNLHWIAIEIALNLYWFCIEFAMYLHWSCKDSNDGGILCFRSLRICAAGGWRMYLIYGVMQAALSGRGFWAGQG